VEADRLLHEGFDPGQFGLAQGAARGGRGGLAVGRRGRGGRGDVVHQHRRGHPPDPAGRLAGMGQGAVDLVVAHRAAAAGAGRGRGGCLRGGGGGGLGGGGRGRGGRGDVVHQHRRGHPPDPAGRLAGMGQGAVDLVVAHRAAAAGAGRGRGGCLRGGGGGGRGRGILAGGRRGSR